MKMSKNKAVRIAVIGTGAMGSHHLKDINTLTTMELAAVCDIDQSKADKHAQLYEVPAFSEHKEMLERIDIDALLIATPHYDHPQIAVDAFEKGFHVLIEKPIAVHVQAAEELILAYEKALEKLPNLVFAVMFQQRTYGFWKTIKSLIDEGELGQLVRITWISTDWFRTQSYYDNGGWRATWEGEGGGLLLNQCPHNLDLYQWFVGMPNRVTGFAKIGKYHHIEVEDEVTAFMEHKNGMIGHLILSTGESPGTNRLEIVGEKGKLVFENDLITFFRNKGSMLDKIKTSPKGFEHVENEKIDISFQHHGQPGHKFIIANFARAILNGEELVAPALEGVNSLTLANAILHSSFIGRPIDLPMDAKAYTKKLQEMIDNSTFKKVVVERAITDLENSFIS
jgi:predicted dehydrogenase